MIIMDRLVSNSKSSCFSLQVPGLKAHISALCELQKLYEFVFFCFIPVLKSKPAMLIHCSTKDFNYIL